MSLNARGHIKEITMWRKTVRLVVLLALVSLTAPLNGRAQGLPAEKVSRIGFLRHGHPPQTFVEAFQHGLRERGYVEGQHVVIPTATLLEHTLLAQGFMGTPKAAFPRRWRPRSRDSTWANLLNTPK